MGGVVCTNDSDTSIVKRLPQHKLVNRALNGRVRLDTGALLFVIKHRKIEVAYAGLSGNGSRDGIATYGVR